MLVSVAVPLLISSPAVAQRGVAEHRAVRQRHHPSLDAYSPAKEMMNVASRCARPLRVAGTELSDEDTPGRLNFL